MTGWMQHVQAKPVNCEFLYSWQRWCTPAPVPPSPMPSSLGEVPGSPWPSLPAQDSGKHSCCCLLPGLSKLHPVQREVRDHMVNNYYCLWSHGWGHHIWSQLCRRVFASLFLLNKIHCQGKLLGVQFAFLTHIAKVPNVSKDILRKARLQEHILDLHPRDEPILVIVCLLKKCLVPAAREG